MKDGIYPGTAKLKAVERWENEGGRICMNEAASEPREPEIGRAKHPGEEGRFNVTQVFVSSSRQINYAKVH